MSVRGEDPDLAEAFNRIYDAHRQAVHSYFLGRTGDPEPALDLLQEAFLRAWRHIAMLRELSADRQLYWLFAVARNVLTDHFRRRGAQDEAYQSYGRDLERQAPPSDDPDLALQRTEELALLDRAIRRLPDHLRTVLLMQVVGELSSAQIGELLEQPAGTVRYHLALARRQLAREVRLIEECGAA